jgi:TatD-related deoxyribonuclease
VPLPSDLPVVDHHCHLSPSGEGVGAARRFRAAGGTHLFLCTQSYGPQPPATLEGYREQFETTEGLARKVEQEAGCKVYVVIAPFPVDLVGQVATLGAAGAVELHRGVLDLAGQWVRERRAVALGEVGWPHFDVSNEVREAARSVFTHALEVAHDSDCPVVIHSEELTPEAFHDLAERGRSCGVPPERLVKHYARTSRSLAERSGMAASYVARRELVTEVLTQEAPFFLETDFLDDPRRPGAVLDLATVPRRAVAIASQGSAALERLRVPFVESVSKVYGFAPSMEGLSQA